MDSNSTIIISAGIGGWYAKGIDRLENSLNFVGWPYAVKTWKNEYPEGSHNHKDVPYYFKISAFEWARKQGYKKILWVDASFWTVKSPIPIFNLTEEQGYFAFRSGYTLAQSVNDTALSASKISRDEAESINEYASGCVCINLDNPSGKGLYQLWKNYMDIGLSKGSREHDNQSQDKRFLHHRQDQSCLSIAMHKLGLVSLRDMDYVSYFGSQHNKDKVIFFIQGM